MLRIALFLVAFTASSFGFASCLEDITKFANDICGQIKTTGNQNLISAEGKLDAKVVGIVSAAINARGEMGAKLQQDSYENVLREDLGKELFNVRDCRRKMAEVGRAEACSSRSTESKLWQRNWATLNEPIPHMSYSGNSATNRERFLSKLNALQLSSVPVLESARRQLVTAVLAAPARPDDPTYNMLVSSGIDAQFQELRRGVRDEAIAAGVELGKSP